MWFKEEIRNVLSAVDIGNANSVRCLPDAEVTIYRDGFRAAIQAVGKAFGLTLVPETADGSKFVQDSGYGLWSRDEIRDILLAVDATNADVIMRLYEPKNQIYRQGFRAAIKAIGVAFGLLRDSINAAQTSTRDDNDNLIREPMAELDIALNDPVVRFAVEHYGAEIVAVHHVSGTIDLHTHTIASDDAKGGVVTP